MGKHELTRLATTRTWGKPSPSPLIVFFVLGNGANAKCDFVSKLPNGGPEIPKTKTPSTLAAYNFVYKPLIELRKKSKVVAFIKSFPTVCGMPPKRKEIKVIVNF